MVAWPVTVQGQHLFQALDATTESISETGVPVESMVLRSGAATFDRSVLSDSLPPGSRFVLNLFPDAMFDATTVRSRTTARTTYVHADLADGGYVLVFVAADIVRAEVHSPNGTYTLRTDDEEVSAGTVRIKQVDASRLPHVDDHPHLHDIHFDGRNSVWPTEASPFAPSAVNGSATGRDVAEADPVDVLMLYTPDVETEESKVAIETTIMAELEKTNETLVESGIDDRRFRLVAVERVEYRAAHSHMHDVLWALKRRKGDEDDNGSDPEGALDEVHAIRERYAADLVHLVVGSVRGPCGSAFELNRHVRVLAAERCGVDALAEPCLSAEVGRRWRPWPFSVSRPGCTANHTIPHELGHTFGVAHDRYQSRQDGRLGHSEPWNWPVTPYGFGYVNQNFDRSHCAYTLMATFKQCSDEGRSPSRRLLFSNPDLAINDHDDPAGVAGEDWTPAVDGPANAARAMAATWDIMANLFARAQVRRHVPFVPRADDAERQGFVRIVNHGDRDGEVAIVAFDDDGTRYDPITLTLAANQTRHFNSDDLEEGNVDKGLSGGVGSGSGDWRLEITSALDIEVLAYIRTTDGFLTSMHDLMPASGPGRRAPVFNPASNENQVSLLRVVNTGGDMADVVVTAVDDNGDAGGEVRLAIPGHAATTLTAQELEAGGEDFHGAFGDGHGKWRLYVERERTIDSGTGPVPNEDNARVLAMSLLKSPTGHLTNLSSVPRNETRGVHSVLLFPAKSDANRQGFVRVVNQTGEAGEANIVAFDDAGDEYGPVTLALGAGETRHFNSDDLQDGNADKGLSAGIGEGQGDWRLEMTSDLDLEVLAYVRTDRGFLTAMHDAAPSRVRSHRLAVFNPAENINQVSSLRLVNMARREAGVTVTGVDDQGESPGGGVRFTLPPKASRTFTVQTLEPGSDDFEGSLGAGRGKWQLLVEADRRIVAVGLLSSPTGHLTNLSTAPLRGVGPWPPEDVANH